MKPELRPDQPEDVHAEWYHLAANPAPPAAPTAHDDHRYDPPPLDVRAEPTPADLGPRRR